MRAGLSMRWNRQPIKTGSSEHDDRGGGGVSLATVNDFDDSTTQGGPYSDTFGGNYKKHTVPPSKLNCNAQSFNSSVYTEVPTRSGSPESSSSSGSVMSSASQPTATQLAQSAASGENPSATDMRTNLYDKQQRTRSATMSVHEQYATDGPHGHYGYGSATAHSSPIKSVALDYVSIAESDVSDGRSDVSEAQHTCSCNSPVYQTPITSQGTASTSGCEHIRSGSQTSSSDKHSTSDLLLDDKQPVTPSYSVVGKQVNGTRYNAKAPAFSPATNKNNFEINTVPSSQAVSSTQHQRVQRPGFVNSGAPFVESAQDAHSRPSPSHKHHSQMNGFTPIAANNTQVTPTTPSTHYHQHRDPWYPTAGGHNQLSHSNSTPGYFIHPPQMYSQYPYMGPNHSPRKERVEGEQLNHYTGNRAPITSANGGDYQESQIPNTPPTIVRKYNHGLPGSASAGSLSQYLCANGQSSTSTALVQINNQSVNVPHTVGPLDFEIPSRETMANRSEMLQALTENGRPSLEDVFDPKFLPFIANHKYSEPSAENGVVIIRNIPYETTRGEIIAFLGKSCRILNDRQEPVHIIMDRVTGKTLDAFCEISSLDAAIQTVERFKIDPDNNRVSRLGNRVVEVQLSSQSVLMQTLFPSSRNGVEWIGTHPNLISGSQYSWENFSCFLTEEEMIMLNKHIENTQRSMYAKLCPERPYECMISTLRKMPWYMADHITMKQRQSVYECCMKMIEALVNKVRAFEHIRREDERRRNGDRNSYEGSQTDAARGNRQANTEATRLTPQLLDRLVNSAMLCAGFSVVQKHNIATLAGLSEQKCREFNQPRFPDSWVYQWTLVPKADMPIDVLEWYIAVIRTETNRAVQSLDLYQRMALQGTMKDLDGYWGYFWAEASFPTRPSWDKMSLADCSRLEWQAIERIITRAIQGGNIPPSYTSRS
ncbi:hypothetical protein F4678DRAFT_457097 [Xylaria arbuscula]|nr:hypothetical protein F4678DRAFT_457097 [Xylaria arbuscula]